MYKFNKHTSPRTVIVRDGDLNKALRKLKHISEPIMKEYKAKRYYEKPSEANRRKKKEALAKIRKQQRLAELYG